MRFDTLDFIDGAEAKILDVFPYTFLWRSRAGLNQQVVTCPEIFGSALPPHGRVRKPRTDRTTAYPVEHQQVVGRRVAHIAVVSRVPRLNTLASDTATFLRVLTLS
jgi:hypothetical protein